MQHIPLESINGDQVGWEVSLHISTPAHENKAKNKDEEETKCMCMRGETKTFEQCAHILPA
eukprot:7069382-Prorocentrum_lima.AAC.1